MNGPTIAGYEGLVDIGGGGFSRVYRATDLRHSRAVAIKVLSAGQLNEGQRASFHREVQAMGRIGNHPHVVTVLDSGFSDDGLAFMAMPYYEDGTFSSRLARLGQLTAVEVMDLGIKIASALETAHQENIVHRDVKPENIFLGDFGRHALADFGISSFDDPEVTRQKTVGVAMTPAHAAPEVLEDERPTALTDVYSLGSTLYALLSGRPAFSGDSLAGVIRKVLAENPPSLARFDGPPNLKALIIKMMAKPPADRPQSALEVAEILRTIQLEEGLAATAITVRGWSSPDTTRTASQPLLAPPLTTPSIAETYVPGQVAAMVVPQVPTELPVAGGSSGDQTMLGSGLIRPEPGRTDESTAVDDASPRAPVERRRPLLLAGAATSLVLLAGVTFAAMRSGSDAEITDDPADEAIQEIDPDDVISIIPRPPQQIEVFVVGDELRVSWAGQTGPTISYELRHGDSEPSSTELTEIVIPREGPVSDCVEIRTYNSSRFSSWSDPVCARGGLRE